MATPNMQSDSKPSASPIWPIGHPPGKPGPAVPFDDGLGVSTRHRLGRNISTRKLWALLLAACVLVSLSVPSTRGCLHRLKGVALKSGSGSIEERVDKILTDTPLIDGHNDLAIRIRFGFENHINNENFSKPFQQGGLPWHTDLPRLRAGKNGGAFWSVFWDCPANGTDLSDKNYHETVLATYQQIDLVARLREKFPNDFSPILKSGEALKAFKQGQLISPLGVEGLHQIGNSVSHLRQYYELGVRYATLTHNCANKYADAALWESPVRKAPALWGGVSKAGRLLINEMNRIGMIVDLSHTSVDTMRDVLGGSDDWAGSKAPAMFSHSSAYAICPHPRNVPDDILQLVKKTKSVVMVNFLPEFISCTASDNPNGIPDYYPANATLAQVVEHILYIGNYIGFEYVGLGSDYDGYTNPPKGLEDVSKFPDLVAELLRRGVSDEDAAKVVGGNVLRVWHDADVVAARLQADGEPVLEDDLTDLGDGPYFSA